MHDRLRRVDHDCSADIVYGRLVIARLMGNQSQQVQRTCLLRIRCQQCADRSPPPLGNVPPDDVLWRY